MHRIHWKTVPHVKTSSHFFSLRYRLGSSVIHTFCARMYFSIDHHVEHMCQNLHIIQRQTRWQMEQPSRIDETLISCWWKNLNDRRRHAYRRDRNRRKSTRIWRAANGAQKTASHTFISLSFSGENDCVPDFFRGEYHSTMRIISRVYRASELNNLFNAHSNAFSLEKRVCSWNYLLVHNDRVSWSPIKASQSRPSWPPCKMQPN